MKRITEEILLEELNSWVAKYGLGRDKSYQRFGQHIWNNYDLDAIFPVRNAFLDGFNAENPYTAYDIIYTKIIENDILP